MKINDKVMMTKIDMKGITGKVVQLANKDQGQDFYVIELDDHRFIAASLTDFEVVDVIEHKFVLPTYVLPEPIVEGDVKNNRGGAYRLIKERIGDGVYFNTIDLIYDKSNPHRVEINTVARKEMEERYQLFLNDLVFAYHYQTNKPVALIRDVYGFVCARDTDQNYYDILDNVNDILELLGNYTVTKG